MTRIEKTSMNLSAFIVLSSSLKKIADTEVIEISQDGSKVSIRKKNKEEKEDFEIDLVPLDKLFLQMVEGGPSPLVIENEEEQYLKNCSFACYYYLKEKNEIHPHFELFHNIHFVTIPDIEIENDIIIKICTLFRIQSEICLPYINQEKNISKTIELKRCGAFNDIFEKIFISENGGQCEIIFSGSGIEHQKSIDSFFSLKDLLSCRSVITTGLPDQHRLFLEQDQIIKFELTTPNGHSILMDFGFGLLTITLRKPSNEK